MHHHQGFDRNQLKLISLEELVEKQALVRIIDAFVDALNLEKFGFNYYQLNKEGRPPYHPATMMKLYLYGYQNGIRTSRKLEKACKTNLEVLWLLSQQQPHYKTIANFRKDNAKSFKQVFRYFVALLKDWNLIDGQTIAIDSFKIRAQNSLKNNFNQRKVKRHLEYIDGKIAEYEQELDKEFSQETTRKLAGNRSKKAKYQAIDEELIASGDGQISTTDPEAKAVVFQRNSVKVGYNVQAATDGKNKLFIAADTGDVNDTKALSTMVGLAKNNLGTLPNPINVLADKGYHSGRELKACETMGVVTYVSPKESSSTKSNPAFAMDAFNYNEPEDHYTCPANEILQTNGKWYNKSLKNGRKPYLVKHYKTKACQNCELRAQCTTNKHGRLIERTEHAQYVQANNQRVINSPDYYRERQQIIEHQFGTLKRQRNFDFTLMKGKQKVLAEVYIAFTIYNLGRSLSILGFSDLLSKIKTLIALLLSETKLRYAVAHNTTKNFLRYISCHHASYNQNATLS